MAVVALWTGSATGATIGLFTDSTSRMCSTSLLQGETTRILVQLDSENAVDSGEFWISGVPSGWTTQLSVVDEADRLSVIGTADGFSFWMTPQRGRVSLFYLTVWAATVESNVALEVSRHLQPNPPPGTPEGCPWVHYDAPASPGHCAQGGRFTINGSGDCLVAVREESWARVRGLYR